MIKFKNVKLYDVIILLSLILLGLSSFFIFNAINSKKIENIKKENYFIYSKHIRKNISVLIKNKKDLTSVVSLVLSNNKTIVEALKTNNSKLINLKQLSELLNEKTPYKNFWFHITDNKGISFYKSWTTKRGESILKIRQDIVKVLKNHKMINTISVGKYDMTFKSIVPIFDNKNFIGTIETVSHFNSIANKLLENLHINSIVLVNKTYKKQLIYARTRNFIEDYYIANKNAKHKFIDIIKEKGADYYFNNKKEYIIDSKNNQFIVTYNLFDINHNLMAKIITFKKLNKISFVNIRDIKKHSIFYIIITILILFLIAYYLITRKHRKELEKREINLKEKIIELHKLKEAKSTFLANMSHEIRTPLNAITGFIDLLEERIKDIKSKEYLEIIKSSSESLLQIINDILDFSKIESGKLDIDKHPFETKKEFKTITNLFDARASKKNITLILDLDKNLPEILISDPLRIKQVIANLISNAVKFTSEGKKIIISIQYNDNNLFVSVKDEGIGIPKNKQSKIFESFSQADSSTTRKYGGTGLGLAISYQLIKLLGNELKLKSEEGKGSEFYFSIPAEIGKLKKEKENILENIDKLKGKKVLVVEDNQANQMFMKIFIKKLGLKFDIAKDGIEAVEKFKENKYDFILMDENMPNMNGIEATKKILKYEKEKNLKHTPIIALTANAIKGDREKFLEAGMDEYLTKPLNKEKLTQTFNKLLL